MSTSVARRPGPMALAFLKRFPSNERGLTAQAQAVNRLLMDLLAGGTTTIHAITSRPKEYASALEKVIRKGYGRPKQQLTDLVGARVVTFYPTDVDRVVALLRSELQIHPDTRLSPDWRVRLDTSEFGYRSVHLVASVGPRQIVAYPQLKNLWFEIQVRSILEDSWAEFDHDIVYKIRAGANRDLLRGFSSLAAVLEFVDRGFESLRSEQSEYIAKRRDAYSAGDEMDERLDPSRVQAVMDATRRTSPQWTIGFPTDEAAIYFAGRVVDVLSFIDVRTGRELTAALSGSSLADDVAEYAATAGLGMDAISHSTVLLLCIGRIDASLVLDCFPDMANDPYLAKVLGF